MQNERRSSGFSKGLLRTQQSPLHKQTPERMTAVITISLCMIVKNEEDTLGRCLDSVGRLADELIIADTGSTDRTKEIASAYTDSVFDFPWQDDFSAARNFAFSRARMQYCLWLDADDVILPGDLEAMLSLKETLSPQTDVVMMRYNTAFDAEGNPAFSYYRERLIRRGAGLLWKGAIHESIAPVGNVVYFDAAVTHKKLHPGDPDRNLRIFEKLIYEGKTLEPREQFYYARELTYHGRDEEAADVLETFLADGLGWVENNIEACRTLSQCYHRLGESRRALSALLRSLAYGPPRAEICCDLGAWFFNRSDYLTAKYWYEQALSCTRNDRGGGFVIPDCYGYLPALQLCVCCYRLGDRAQAVAYNEMAGAIKPHSASYLFNQKFFEDTAAEETTGPVS